MKKISVIVPVYNVAKYLTQCVESIVSQTYSNIEIILVDDGSYDGSSEMCDKFASSDKRILVVHKSNGGLSDARNAGLDIATGEYVMFVDSDDFWKDNQVIEKLNNYLATCGNEVDFINFNCIYYYQKDEEFKWWPRFPNEVINGDSREDKIIGLISSGMFPMSACMKIIRRDFLKKNNIYFIKGIFSEDIPWFVDLLLKSNNFRFINEYLYVYRKQVPGTISSSFSERKYYDLFDIVEAEIQQIMNSHVKIEMRNALMSFMAYEYCILLGMVNNFGRGVWKKELLKLEGYKWLLEYDLNPKVRLVKRVKKVMGPSITSRILAYYIKKYVNKN